MRLDRVHDGVSARHDYHDRNDLARFGTCICSAQSGNRYHSRMALRKVRIPTWLRNSRMVSDHSRIAQGIFSVLSIR